MRIWARIWKDNHLLRDTVVEDCSDDTRTHRIFHCLNEVCMIFDLAVPQWLDVNIREFQRASKTRFRRDSFIEDVNFDYLEFEVLEE